MAHHLNYIELAWFVGVLGTLRLLFQFAIKMIAIFARDKFSARAFKVLMLDRREHRATIFRSRTNDRPRTPYGEVEAGSASRTRTGMRPPRPASPLARQPRSRQRPEPWGDGR
jgi:hypothetical protein